MRTCGNMAIFSPPPPGIAGSVGSRSFSDPDRLAPSLALRPAAPRRRSAWIAVSACLHSSKPSSGANGSCGSSSSAGAEELQHGLPPHPRPSGGAAVFVTLPADAVGVGGQMSRRKTMAASFAALAKAGVEGVAVEVWWGIVEMDAPGAYNWAGYMDLVAMARRHGLKVRVVMAFHQSGSGPGDPCWFPLPQWVLEEMGIDPDLAYTDRHGRRSKEYISLGCDCLPVLKGRTPIQAYSDFIRNFRDTFREFLGVTITEVQVGMGPAGELRYPSFPSEKLTEPSSAHVVGEFQCYDKYMLASLNACAQNSSKNSGGIGGRHQNAEETCFFQSDDSWNRICSQFLIGWYSEMLLLHGERLCVAANAIFRGTRVKILAKIAGIQWQSPTNSRQSELTAGSYNALIRDHYLPIARMLCRHRMTLCCTCFHMQDVEQNNPESSPEGFLRHLIYAARMCTVPLASEEPMARLDDASLKRLVKSSKLYTDGLHSSHLSFNFVRMDKNLFDSHNWTRFTRFVRQMSDARTFQAKLGYGASELCLSTTVTEKVGRAFAYF